MIVKWSSLPTGVVFTGAFYDATVSPEAVIAAAGGVFTEDAGGLGVFRRNVGANLAGFTLVRVRLTPGSRDAWLLVELGDQEVVDDPFLFTLIQGIDAIDPCPDPCPDPCSEGGDCPDVIYPPAFAVPQDAICGYDLYAKIGEEKEFSIPVLNADGTPFDFTGITLIIVVEGVNGADWKAIPDGDIDVVGNVVTFTVTADVHDRKKRGRWSLRNTSGNIVILDGEYIVSVSALEDSP